MFRGLTRKIAPIFAIILSFSVVVSACGSTATTTPSASPSASASADASASSSAPPASVTTSYKIGINTWGSGVPVLDQFGDNGEYVFKVLGSTTMRASDDFTPDKESANVQNFCSAGVNGLDLQAAGVTNLLQMAQTAQNAKVPFVINTFVGSDADRAKLADSNPYYVGSIANDLVEDGKTVADIAIADGCKTAVILGGNIGDTTQDLRLQGFTEEFTAKGGTVLANARCTDASEAPAKAEDMLSANKDVQAVYAMVGDYVPGAVSALDNLGLTGKVNIYLSGVDKHSAGYIKDGTVKAGADGLFLASYIAPTLLLNYLDGHPIKDQNGKAPELRNNCFKVDSANIDAYMSIFTTDGVNPITDDMLKNLCWRYNSSVTYQTYVDLLDSGLTLNALLTAHNLPTVG
ncbi:ABC-type sugar transport system, substrate-binding protein, contains N-terminal xre family HTH domain [Sporobacter termitidis DSM 10068]|uniref:ABC-type sugar transport system, substrate-binding protein, contains N-terminal xre family HTH domain n=1 Tax=Sporobacter termitidis DSM 10068 TaxID=1123282 RepID=A0A1M5YZW9_9FIRM|nr:substrate-binding domain-containing protein [Sporobacter termitidis]SHI17541.1 ABC-type sugar transport system, substrate-binding protein, contains N-terminal xre family HTH domain [Sporobacter termitidis DSM 10068]